MMLVSLLAATHLFGAPAMARTRHRFSCTKIDQAISAGKSPDEVAKQLKVPVARVNDCTARAAKSHGTAKDPEAR
jgi:hypothetical protein